jgi:hypothetical protein
MAITLEASSETTLTGTATSHAITLPTGIEAGDIINIYCSTQESSDAGAPTTPSGYTQRWSLGHSSSFKPRITSVWKLADGSEDSTSVTFTWGTLVETHIVALVWRGVNPGTPFDVTQTGPTSGASNPDPASIATATDGAVVLAIVAANRTPTPSVTISSGYTLAFSQVPDNRAFVIAYKTVGTAGADDPAAYAWATLDNSTTVTDALRPFTGGSAALTMALAVDGGTAVPTLYEGGAAAMAITLEAAGTAALIQSASISMAVAVAGAGDLTQPGSVAMAITVDGGTGFARDRGVEWVAQGEQALLAGTWSTATASSARLFTTDPTAALTHAQRSALTEADFTEANFTGYTSAALTSGNWTITPGSPTEAAHTTVTYSTSADLGAPVDVWGYYVTRNTDGKLMWFEVFTDAPVTLSDNGDQVSFDPTFTIS